MTARSNMIESSFSRIKVFKGVAGYSSNIKSCWAAFKAHIVNSTFFTRFYLLAPFLKYIMLINKIKERLASRKGGAAALNPEKRVKIARLLQKYIPVLRYN